MLGPPTRILSITTSGCDCHLAGGGRLLLEARFVPGEGQDFAAFARSRRGSVFRIVADQIDEDFRPDSLPFLRGPARTRLLERKTGQVYRDSPYHTSASLGRQSDGRRDERVQLLGLTNAGALNEWLTPLAAAEVRVAGLFSPPVAAPDLLRLLQARTGRPPGRVLLVSLNRSGLRQTLVDDGIARFSRLAVVGQDGEADFAAACLAEVNKTHQYLVGLRLLSREEALQALFLVPPGEEAAWSRPGRLVEAIDAVFLDLAEARRSAGLRRVEAAPATGVAADEEARFADTLWAHAVARSRPRLDFAPAWLREPHRLWRARVAIWSSGALLLAAGLGWSAERLAQSGLLLETAARLRAEAGRNDSSYERIKRGFPPLPAPAEQLKASVVSFEGISARAVAPGALLAEVGQALARTADFRLLRLDWQQGGSDPAQAPGTVAAMAPGGTPPARFEWVTLHGRVGAGADPADARANTDSAMRTAALLETVRGATVVIVRAPLDLSPRGRIAGSSLAGGGGMPEAAGEGANVEIRVSRQVGP